MRALARRCWRRRSRAADIKVDLSKETVGKPPATFEPMVGTWVVAQDGADKVIMVDGRPWVASKDNPTKLLIESARKLYGTSNEELMDNAKQFAYYPVAVLQGVDNFIERHDQREVQDHRRRRRPRSGILFNVKPNGDWLAVRYNDTENNVALWEFHNGIRRNMRFSDRAKQVHARSRRVARAEADGRRRRPQGLARRRARRSSTRSAASPGPAATARRRIPDLFPRTTRCCGRRSPARSACGRRPTRTSYFKDYVVSPK